ncbi:MAG: GspMb/PilO family protein [Thermodesulfovibrionales bacterium]
MKRNKTLIAAVPALLVLLGLVLYQYVYLGIRAELSSIKEQQAAKTATLRKYIAIISEKPELEKKLSVLAEKAKANKAKLIEGEPVSLASANLQETVKGIVSGRGGALSSERIGKPEDAVKSPAGAGGAPGFSSGMAGGKGKGAPGVKNAKSDPLSRFKVIGISIDASVPDPAALSDILYSLETRTPFLAITELDARVKNFKTPKELMVKLDVSGLYGGK